MTEKEFIELTKGEGAALLLKSGDELARRNEPGFEIVLFMMDNFFTELWYQQQTKIIVKVSIIEIESVLINYPNLVDLNSINELPIERNL